MRIRVHSGKGDLSLVLPTRMIFSKTLVKFGIRMGKRYSDNVPDLPPAAIDALCDEIHRIKKQYGSWKLVELHSADGDTVTIIL